MKHTYTEGLWWIVVENNQALLYTPDGKEVYAQVTTRITETVGELPKAFVKFCVNLAGSQQEMNDGIKTLEEQKDERSVARKVKSGR